MSEEKAIKQIPYAVSDFNKFRKGNYYYVDKTSCIRNIEKKGQYLIFVRPRRFGKSLFLSMLESYYDINKQDQFDLFFRGTDIHQNPSEERNSYMVLKLDFSKVASDISLAKESFLNYVKNSASDFVMKYEKFLGIDMKEANAEFNAIESASQVLETLLHYCSLKEQKVYVIIDDYDNFANTILSTVGEQAFKDINHWGGFFHAFFSVLKAGTSGLDAPVSRIFMAGVLPITLDGIISGFNIARNLSLDPDLNEMLGFNRSEVETMIEYYRQTGKIRHSTPELLEIMSRWYNHYRFSVDSDTDVFNTSHILYFIQEYLDRSKLSMEMIDRNVRSDYNKLRYLLTIGKKGIPSINANFSKIQKIFEKQEIRTMINKSFSLSALPHPNNLVSLLYYFGLLTIRGIDEEDTIILVIPNESAKYLYNEVLVLPSFEMDGTGKDGGNKSDKYDEDLQELFKNAPNVKINKEIDIDALMNEVNDMG
ncbi:MAG: AAA family ATPase [Candidatus Omnitrophota bacterium]